MEPMLRPSVYAGSRHQGQSSQRDPEYFSVSHFYLDTFLLPDLQDITIPSQKGRNRKLGDVYSISVLGNRCCPCGPPFDHYHQGRRNYFAGKLLAQFPNVCGEKSAGSKVGEGSPYRGCYSSTCTKNEASAQEPLRCDSKGECSVVERRGCHWARNIFRAREYFSGENQANSFSLPAKTLNKLLKALPQLQAKVDLRDIER